MNDNDKQRGLEAGRELAERDLRDALEDAFACLEHERPYEDTVRNRILAALDRL